jgi:hypothetical protein
MTDEGFDHSDEALGRRLAETLPRYGAPGHLRAAILEAAAPRPRHPAWLPPAVAAFATALLLVLIALPFVPRLPPTDAVGELVSAAVAEHTLPWLAQESGIELKQTFLGDERLRLEGGEPVYMARRRGIAIYYKDDEGHLLTYITLPDPELKIPERHRLQIGRFRPALLNDSGFSALVWKQGNLACLLIADMVSDNDIANLKDYFVRVRASTEPAPAY